MILQSGQVTVDILALRKQFKLKPDEQSEAHHIEQFFKGKRWHVLAECGGSLSWKGNKRFISSHETYDNARKTYMGWMREAPMIIYFQNDGTAVLVQSSSYAQKEECLKNQLALADAGVLKLLENERNQIICDLDPSRKLELGEDRGPDHLWFGVPDGKVHWNRFFNGRPYTATAPQGDSERMAALGERLMFRHGNVTEGGQPELFIAPAGVITSGWVVGVMKKV